jgi:hypothetical protein
VCESATLTKTHRPLTPICMLVQYVSTVAFSICMLASLLVHLHVGQLEKGIGMFASEDVVAKQIKELSLLVSIWPIWSFFVLMSEEKMFIEKKF